MNRSSFALFVALLIHLLLLALFWVLGTLTPEMKKAPQEKEKKIKISLKEMPKTEKKSGHVEKKVKPTPIAPQIESKPTNNIIFFNLAIKNNFQRQRDPASDSYLVAITELFHR